MMREAISNAIEEILRQYRFTNTKIERTDNESGRGVFAQCDLVPGDLVEAAHVIVIPNRESRAGSVIDHYSYWWDDDNVAIATGTALLYNHSDNPNVDWELDKETATIDFRALKYIDAGQELTISYSDDPKLLTGVRAKRARGEK